MALAALLQRGGEPCPSLPSSEGGGCSALQPLLDAEGRLAALRSAVPSPSPPAARVPKAGEGQDLFEHPLQKSSSTFSGRSAPWLSDHLRFLPRVSCLGSSSDTQALDARRGWCFLFPPCSSAILFWFSFW